MKEDITIPAVTHVKVAIARKSNEINQDEWSVHLLNLNEFPITNVLVSSKGYGGEKEESQKTSVLRHFFENIEAGSSVMVELIQPEVFHLNNEYWVSYYHNGMIHDKKFIFLPDTIQEGNLQYIELLQAEAILHS